MERKTYRLIFTLYFLFVAFLLQADNKTKIYSAYTSGNMEQWKKVIDQMSGQPLENQNDLLELINYQYGYIAWCIGNSHKSKASKYLEKAEENLKMLKQNPDYKSYYYMYQSAFYGFEIGLNRLKAPVVGMESVDYAKKAIALDENNPYALINYGNTQFYMPEIFGGSKKIAIEYYNKALKIMEQDEHFTENNWNYLSLLTLIAQSYQKTENLYLAKVFYEKIMRIEPDYHWVKHELYPELLQSLNDQNS